MRHIMIEEFDVLSALMKHNIFLIFCLLVNFGCFLSWTDFTFEKFFQVFIRVSNSLDPDQADKRRA